MSDVFTQIEQEIERRVDGDGRGSSSAADAGLETSEPQGSEGEYL